MLPETPEFRSPPMVTLLRAFGVVCLIAAGGVGYAGMECAGFVPLATSAYVAIVGLLALLPLAAGFGAFGLADVVDATARTAWELRVRRRG